MQIEKMSSIFLIRNQAAFFFGEDTSKTINPISGEKIILQNIFPQNPIMRFIPKTPIITLTAK